MTDKQQTLFDIATIDQNIDSKIDPFGLVTYIICNVTFAPVFREGGMMTAIPSLHWGRTKKDT